MKKNITKEQKQIIIMYRNDYIDAIEELIKIYEKKLNTFCPFCKLDGKLMSLLNVDSCSTCLWMIFEGKKCMDWKRELPIQVNFWYGIRTGTTEELNSIRLQRIKTLKSWLRKVKRLK